MFFVLINKGDMADASDCCFSMLKGDPLWDFASIIENRIATARCVDLPIAECHKLSGWNFLKGRPHIVKFIFKSSVRNIII